MSLFGRASVSEEFIARYVVDARYRREMTLGCGALDGLAICSTNWYIANRALLLQMAALVTHRAIRHLRVRSPSIYQADPSQLDQLLASFAEQYPLQFEPQYERLEDDWFGFLGTVANVQGEMSAAALRDRARMLASRLCRELQHSPSRWPVLIDGRLTTLAHLRNHRHTLELSTTCEIFAADPRSAKIHRVVIAAANIGMIADAL